MAIAILLILRDRSQFHSEFRCNEPPAVLLPTLRRLVHTTMSVLLEYSPVRVLDWVDLDMMANIADSYTRSSSAIRASVRRDFACGAAKGIQSRDCAILSIISEYFCPR
jgi:hypothetical protein